MKERHTHKSRMIYIYIYIFTPCKCKLVVNLSGFLGAQESRAEIEAPHKKPNATGTWVGFLFPFANYYLIQKQSLPNKNHFLNTNLITQPKVGEKQPLLPNLTFIERENKDGNRCLLLFCGFFFFIIIINIINNLFNLKRFYSIRSCRPFPRSGSRLSTLRDAYRYPLVKCLILLPSMFFKNVCFIGGVRASPNWSYKHGTFP